MYHEQSNYSDWNNPSKLNECRGKHVDELQSKTNTLGASQHFPGVLVQFCLPLYVSLTGCSVSVSE
jgi:hypothetical protein